MEKKITSCLICCLSSLIQLDAQPLQFRATYPDVIITSVSQTADNGYIISGYSDVYGIGENDIVMIRTDSTGNMIWKKTFGNSANSGAEDVPGTAVENTDGEGGYYLAGQLWNQANQTYEVYVLKTDSIGNKLWSKTMYNGGYDKGMSVVNAAGGGCLVTGWVGNSSQGYLGKLDANGNILWQKSVSKGIGAWVLQLGQPTIDSGIVAGGYDNELGSYEMWLVKTNSSGAITLQKGYAMSGTYNFCYDVCQADDKGYLLGGGSNGINLVKTDSNGVVVWAKNYFASFVAPRAYSVTQCADHGFVILSNDISNNQYLMKINSIGDIEWATVYPGGYYINTVEQTSDEGFVLAMGAEMIKTDKNGLSGCADLFFSFSDTILSITTRTTAATATSQTVSADAVDGSTDPAIPVTTPCLGTPVSDTEVSFNEFTVYPNPSHGAFKISLPISEKKDQSAAIDILDQAGKVVSSFQGAAKDGLLEHQISINDLSSGFYLIRITTDKKTYQTKLGLQKE